MLQKFKGSLADLPTHVIESPLISNVIDARLQGKVLIRPL
jgi:hypothetical protein